MDMKLNKFITCTLFFSLSIQVVAQNVVSQRKKADLLFEKADYYNAIDQYNTVIKNDPKNTEVWFRLGNSYFFSRNHKGAANAYDRLSRLIEKNKKAKTKYYKAYLRQGQSLMALENYKEAKKAFLNFLRVRSTDSDYKDLKRVANNRIKSCDAAILLHSKSYAKEFTISTNSNEINSGYSDFAPVWKDSSTLIFTSLNKDKLIHLSPSDPFPVNQQLFSSRFLNNTWEKPEVFEEFSHDFFHIANGSFSENGEKFVFSRCQENERHQVRCDLYISKYEDGQWSKPSRMKGGINAGNSTSTQPAFGHYKIRGRNKEVLYFVSDRLGGRGQLDIWYSTFIGENNWTSPVNCGGVINTKGNEVTPYYHGATTELFFSSDFHYGLGGYDVFKAYGGLKSYKKPENLGIPLNSSYDDTYFSWRTYLENGTLVSNRTGSQSVFLENCCDDIYYYEYKSAHVIEGHVIAFDSVEMDIGDVDIGLADLEHLEYQDSINWIGETDVEGNFKLRYEQGKDAYLVVAKEDYETHYIKISELVGEKDSAVTVNMIKAVKWEEQLEEIKANEIQILTKNSLSTKSEKGAIFVMEHIYFDFSKAKIKPESYQDLILLEEFLRTNPKKKIEVGGHTDNIGSNEHNYKLSQQRSEAIRNYLIQKGIEENRLIAVGYGEDKPIADNQNPDGTDNSQGRRLNRRTEVKILN